MSPDLVNAFIQACTLVSAVATLIYTVILIRHLRDEMRNRNAKAERVSDPQVTDANAQ